MPPHRPLAESPVHCRQHTNANENCKARERTVVPGSTYSSLTASTTVAIHSVVRAGNCSATRCQGPTRPVRMARERAVQWIPAKHTAEVCGCTYPHHTDVCAVVFRHGQRHARRPSELSAGREQFHLHLDRHLTNAASFSGARAHAVRDQLLPMKLVAVKLPVRGVYWASGGQQAGGCLSRFSFQQWL